MGTITLAIAIFCVLIGVHVLRENPSRRFNRAFAVVSMIFAAWLFCVAQAMRIGTTYTADALDHVEFWLRANAIVSVFYSWGLWLVRDSIVVDDAPRRIHLRDIVLVIVFACSIF